MKLGIKSLGRSYDFEWNGNTFWVIEKCDKCDKKVEAEYSLVKRKELMEISHNA
jgi:hypothetical protein|tara:strand:+ start:95 stop:256 length:162 start_codon:yes stop_codon:yes gene_type:complete